MLKKGRLLDRKYYNARVIFIYSGITAIADPSMEKTAVL